MNSDFVTITVKLPRVSKDEAQAAVEAMECVFDEYELPDDARLALWDHYQTLASDVLIRFGQFNPDVSYPEGNGHA
jgi:hypothetical protein